MNIPHDSIKATFVQAGRGRWDRSVDGFIHRKTCPCAIVAQVTMGQYEIACGKERPVLIKTGEAFLTAPDVPLTITHHCDQRTGLMMSHWIHFSFSVFDALDLMRFLKLPPRVEERWASTFGGVSEDLLAVQAPPTGNHNDLATAARINELAFKLLRLLCEFLPPESGLAGVSTGMTRLLPAIEHTRRHLDTKTTVAEMAKRVGLSTPRFHAEFRRWFGEPPLEHVRKMRLAKASELLRGTDLSLEETAQATGFCNQFHLSREFKKMYGRPPSAFRRDSRDGLVA